MSHDISGFYNDRYLPVGQITTCLIYSNSSRLFKKKPSHYIPDLLKCRVSKEDTAHCSLEEPIDFVSPTYLSLSPLAMFLELREWPDSLGGDKNTSQN